MGGEALLKVVAQHFDVLALPVVALLYPLYASVKAIESESRQDDRQWLTYWVLYSMITLFEITFSTIIAWIPFWSYAKLIATCWLVLPYFSGASYVYEHFIRPCFINPHPVNIWFFTGKEKTLSTLPDHCSSAVERYIAENGYEAFERLLTQAERNARPTTNYLGIFDHDNVITWHFMHIAKSFCTQASFQQLVRKIMEDAREFHVLHRTTPVCYHAN